ncbi:bile acid:sodium symporter family protein [Blastococcus sp. MG754426]|uniref:bile acid:sodium symporter family protein n=1 Tax=unclassified Blastococcus TaxID=2619396 RepID=UPI001EF14B9A|nr:MULTISPECIES: bile acid:sodium symporter family protein [unclassified Blastococcus]MCF6506986.1 bile acid:sodium symporter family protein [Blastococcus sp. MG754426]MCF6510985.1 bile acid:sodium symporter family protein [Blastococcus sp. MG754427]MCF6734387.1 bile acid:sodium symporter family protein [Blastococcus sp. KM273129]
MDSALTAVALPLALAVVMFGLGLSLTVGDFTRIARQPKAVVVALALQLLVLPVVCFGLVLLFDLPPLLAVGMLLLAASPGGTTANLFSHLYRGDVALNISLTALNSVIAVVTLPVVTNLAIGWFDPPGAGSLGLQFGKTVQVFAIVLVPVALGMLVRRSAPGFADRSDKPVRILSAVVLALVIVGTMVAERENVGSYLRDVGLPALAFCLASLAVGYSVPRLLGIGQRQAIASSFEIGVHNSTLAIAVAISVLDSVELAVPAAVYGVLMFPVAAAFGWLITRNRATAPQRDEAVPAG